MRQYTMDLTILSLLAVGICYVSGQTFEELPTNARVTEGGSAEFNCTVMSEDPSPTRLGSVWGVQAPGEMEQFLGINDVSMIDLKDGSTAFVGTTFNSPLTIANVNRSLDGTQVRCFRLRSGIPTPQDEPYAFMAVLWNDPISLSVPTVDDRKIIFNITLDASPTPVITIERADGEPIPDKDTRVIIGADTIVFQNLNGNYSGAYIVRVTNAADNQTANFSLNTPDSGNARLSTCSPGVDFVSTTISGFPIPEITCSGPGVTTRNGTIIVSCKNEMLKDGNTIQCTATNALGSRTFSLLFSRPPNPIPVWLIILIVIICVVVLIIVLAAIGVVPVCVVKKKRTPKKQTSKELTSKEYSAGKDEDPLA